MVIEHSLAVLVAAVVLVVVHSTIILDWERLDKEIMAA
jgi:hypothetical protein